MKNLQDTIARYVSSLGPPTLRSEAEVRKCAQYCRQRDDHNIFYLIVDARNGLEIIWHYNIARHFSLGNLGQKQLHDRIHPRWRIWYRSMTELLYSVGIKQLHAHPAMNLGYSISVPLQQADGNYYWYRQFTRPVAYDKMGNVVQLIIEMRLICAYDRLAPEMPRLVIERNKGTTLQPEIQRAGHEVMMKMLLGVVPPSSLVILQAYRQMSRHDGDTWKIPDKQLVEKELHLKRDALNKGIVRLMKSIRANLPALATGSVTDLVNFLNDLCGQPEINRIKSQLLS